MLRKKNKIGSIAGHYLKVYYKAVIIKTVWYWHKNRHMDQQSRIQGQETNFQLHGQLIYDHRGGKGTHQSNDSLFNSGVGKTGQIHAKEKKKGNQTSLTPYTKINSK